MKLLFWYGMKLHCHFTFNVFTSSIEFFIGISTSKTPLNTMWSCTVILHLIFFTSSIEVSIGLSTSEAPLLIWCDAVSLTFLMSSTFSNLTNKINFLFEKPEKIKNELCLGPAQPCVLTSDQNLSTVLIHMYRKLTLTHWDFV